MAILFRFSKEKVKDGFIQRPIIPVILQNSTTVFPSDGILDSGSDCIFLPYDVSEALGLKLSECTDEVLGVESNSKCYKSKCQITIMDKHAREKYPFAVDVLVGQAQQAGDQRIIIGREPIFKAFKITFNQLENQITLTRNSRIINSTSEMKNLRI